MVYAPYGSRLADKVVWKYLRRTKRLRQTQMPAVLADSPILRSRKGVLGQITVKRFSGVAHNQARKTLEGFVERTGEDREGISGMLKCSPRAPKGIQRLAEALVDPRNSRKSIAYLVAETQADVADVIEHYAKGAVHLRKWEAVAAAALQLPAVMRDLIRYAVPRRTLCRTCLGAGQVPGQRNHKKAKEPCQTCSSSGWEGIIDKESQYAIDKVLQIAQVIEEKGSIQVQQNMQVNANLDGRLMERIVGMSDDSDVVDAPEAHVLEADNRQEPS